MRPPKQPRRSTRRGLQQSATVPTTEPVRKSAPRQTPEKSTSTKKHTAARGQQPERPPASEVPGTSARATVAKLRRERTKKETPTTPTPGNRKRSSDPYPLSEKIKIRKKAERRRLAMRLGAAVSVFVIVAAGVWLMFFSSVFAVKSENLTLSIDDPAGIVNEGEIRELVLTADGTPVLRLPAGAIEDRLEALPEVKAAHVAGALPSGVDVTVDARVPVACVGTPDGCVGIAADAAQIEIPQELRDELPTVSMDLESDRAAEHLHGLLDALAALPPDVRSRVQQASVSGTGLIEFSSDAATIMWGSSEENEKKARIIEVLLDQPGGTFDVTVPDAPVTY